MKVCRVIPLLLLFQTKSGYGQNETVTLDWTEYYKKISTADSLFKAKLFEAAAYAYAAAFSSNNQGFASGHKFQAAKAWARIRNADSAMANLESEVGVGFNDHSKLSSEEAFRFLKNHPRWGKLIEQVKENQRLEDMKLGIYKPIKVKLEETLLLDQKYRQAYMDSWKQNGLASKQTMKLGKKMNKLDKSNLKYVTEIIDEHGWISYDTIGFKASQALFLVIQHADSLTQEKYLPVLREAVQKNKAFGHDLALLEDRVLLKRGEKQIYGTQVKCDNTGLKCWVLPIADEKNVDARRKTMGMPPLAVYLKPFGIE